MEKIKNIVLTVAEKLEWLPPLAVRLAVGYVFMRTGWGKLHNLDSVINFFKELGIASPEIQAPIVASLEFGCGILIIAGLGTRLAAIPLACIMAVAIWTAKRAELEGFMDLFQLSEFLFMLLFAWLFTAGPGSVSVDRLICKECAGVDEPNKQ